MDAVIVAIDIGLRLGELRQMKKTEVNFDRDNAYVPKERAKSGRDRWIPLLPRARAILERCVKEVEGEWIFPKDDGKGPRVNFDKTLRMFVATLPKDIAPFSWHDLRCGCRLLQDYGLSMELVSTWLGHSLITVTERHYAFLKVDHLQRAIGGKHREQRDELAEYLAETISRIRRAHPQAFDKTMKPQALNEYRLLGSNQGPLDPQSEN